MNEDGLKILEHAGEGYARLVNGAKWTLACLNYADRFDEKNITDLERHNLTDETFVLLQGEATLLMEDPARGRAGNVSGAPRPAEGVGCAGNVSGAPRPASIPLRRITMEPLKYYNVGAGVWHNIFVSKDARVLVAENADTSKDNTDYLEIATGKVFKKRPTFEEVLPGTYLLKVPFGPVWTGIVLVLGRREGAPVTLAGRPRPASADISTLAGRPRPASADVSTLAGRPRPASADVSTLAGRPRPAEGVNVLIDSSHLDPERYLIPALADLGLKPSDIDWLLNTHVHGDHIGGHHALVTKYGLKTATLRKNADALRDPVKVAIRVRTRFPENSPAPQSYLKGVEPDLLLDEWQGEDALPTTEIANRFACISTPGHDDDCQTWIDTWTGTAFTGDSLQANGTPTQGIGFYRDLKAYRETLKKLRMLADGANVARASSPLLKINNIVLGHEYDGVGCVVKGNAAVKAALEYCEERVAIYGDRIERFRREGAPVTIARRLIGDVGCGMPDQLFLALHTVSEHLKESFDS